MYLLFCISLLFVSTIHVRASEQSLGYNAILDSIKYIPKVQQFVHTSPNSFSKIADSIAKSFDLRSLIRKQKSSVMNEQFANAADIPLMNNTTEAPFSGSTELPKTGSTEILMTVGTTNQTIVQSTEATNHVTVVPTTEIPPPSLPVSERCLRHIEGVILGLTEKQQWAINMIDATGKPPADIFGGNLIWLGDYEECLYVQASVAVNNTSYNFGGQYCLMTVSINGLKSVIVQNPAISVGLCLPDSCSTTDTRNLINSVLSDVSNNSLTTSSVICQEPDKPYDTRAIIVLVVIAVFICIMISGTAYDVLLIQWPQWRKLAEKSEVNGDVGVEVDEKAPLMSRKIVDRGEAEPGIMGKFLLSFSIYTNGAKILNTDQSAVSLTAINGIRFFSMTWVILGHTYAFVVFLADNALSFMPRMIKRITFGAIGNAFVSVDTFFTLSGILLAYLIMKELKKKEGKLNWGMFYFHRFWRLTPPYMLVLMVYVSLFPYIGSGPIWPRDGVEPNYCETAWYYNLLYVNNFVEGREKVCMGWSWYLANDMQFFVISPLILLPLFFFHAAGVAVLLAFLIGTWVATGVLATKWNIPMSALDGGNYMDLYFRPYFRMGPYLVGIYTGYLLYRTNFKYRMNKFVNIFGWIVATVLACLVLYGQHDHLNNGYVSAEVASLYNTVHRTVWGACVCWVVFSCANGYGGFINTFLSWKVFIPLSRLTYCAYLVHPVVIYHFQYTRQRLIHFSDTEMIYEFLGHLVITYGIAFVTSLAFESPMMGLEKVIFKRNDKKK